MSELAARCIREMKLSEKTSKDYQTATGLGFLENLSRLNVFIGPNNGGKSRLLRSLFADDEGFFSTGIPAEQTVRQTRLEAIRAIDELMRKMPNQSEVTDDLSKVMPYMLPLWRRWRPTQYREHFDQKLKIDIDHLCNRAVALLAPHTMPRREVQGYMNAIRAYLTRASDVSNERTERLDIHRVYIPSFRSLHHLEPEELAIPTFPALRRTVIRAYFREHPRLKGELNGSTEFDEMSSTLFTGGELFQVLHNRLLGSREERQRIREFENYLSIHFFDSRQVTLIPRVKYNVPWVKIGDDEEFGIQNLGDGIQQIIIMTLPLYLFADRPLLLFIEEPELYLHPGFQRAFIDRCMDPLHPQHQVFVATHSHQFVDITVDRNLCSVFRVTKGSEAGKNPQFMIEESSTHDFELLRLLGVRNSSVMLSNCTIWVEGITDRLYFRRYLQLYHDYLRGQSESTNAPHYMEDLHYSFVEYGGSNVVHWSFLDPDEGIDVERVCGNLMLIADQDHPKKRKKTAANEVDNPKKDRHEKLRQTLKDRFILLECREVENLLMPLVIARIIQHYEKSEDVIEFPQRSSYAAKPLGDFIDGHLSKTMSERKRGTYSDNGPVKDKARFCELACEFLTSWSDLSPEAQRITESIYQFIRDQNHHKSRSIASR